MGDTATKDLALLIRHEGEASRERSTCGWRDLLISRQDSGQVSAWAQGVDINGAREHYHKRNGGRAFRTSVTTTCSFRQRLL